VLVDPGCLKIQVGALTLLLLLLGVVGVGDAAAAEELGMMTGPRPLLLLLVVLVLLGAAGAAGDKAGVAAWLVTLLAGIIGCWFTAEPVQ
jgi:hypothetical protein